MDRKVYTNSFASFYYIYYIYYILCFIFYQIGRNSTEIKGLKRLGFFSLKFISRSRCYGIYNMHHPDYVSN